jgi:serine/threonine-protein kinase
LQGDLASAIDIARFRAEAESAAGLQHPNIVPVYEVGEEQGRPFFSMKYIEGTTLAKCIADGPLPPREAAERLLPVVRAISTAHQRGLLHRDLKPSNILIDSEDRPYVTDFGLAKRWTPSSIDTTDQPASVGLTLSGAILGTPGYMAPEQAAGKRGRVSPLTDVYSLGALLYVMLTGRAPFQAATPVETVLMVLEQDPLLPRLLNRNADPDLEMIALKCLQKPADLRYQSADCLADDLEAYLSNEPISARSSQFSQVLSRAFRETHHAAVLENWGLLWMLHSAVLLVLCLLTNWFQWRDVTSRLPYLALWTVGLGTWAAIFWNLRRRSGPITFVERQIAHVWAGSMISSTGLFVVEWILNLPVLALSPVLGLVSGMVFLVKAGILSGAFYIQALLLFLTATAMAILQQPGMPTVGISLFGIVSAGCFFFPGLKYYQQRIRAERN